ncbi:MAG: M55 family metallopeptidase [Candidatus Sumerlaeota bacterium]
MKIYILTDMEGISGIYKIEQVKSDQPDYGAARKLMMDDINAAVDAAFAAGATEVVANDTHGGGGQLRVEIMDSRATYETPNEWSMMPSLDATFDGVVLLGHHAMAGTANAFLDHTVSSAAWFEFRVNGRECGEIGIEAAYAGNYDVPVIAVSGDEATEAEARDFLGEVECAVVKRAVCRNRANCFSIEEAHKRIRDAVGTAVMNIDRYKPYKPELPATLDLTLYRTDMADKWEGRRDLERTGPRSVRAVIDSLEHMRAFG